MSTLDKLTELFDVTFDELAASNSGLASAGLSTRPEKSPTVAQNEECGIYKIVRFNGGFSLKKSGHTFVPGPVLDCGAFAIHLVIGDVLKRLVKKGHSCREQVRHLGIYD